MSLDALRDSSQGPFRSTLLELVCVLGELTDREDVIEAMARDLVNSGRVVLTGNFRGQKLN